MEEIGLLHGIVKYIHVLLFVYWLGADVGVFHAARFVRATALR